MKKTTIIFIIFLLSLSTFASVTDSLLTKIKQAENPEKIDLYIKLAEYQDDADSTLIFLEKALDIANDEKLEDQIAKINLKLADLYNYNLGLYEKAIPFYMDAEKYYKKHNDKEKLIQIYQNIGFIYEKTSDFDNAGKNYLSALKLLGDNNKLQKARILNSLGTLYFNQKNIDGAIEYWNQALNIVEELKFKKGISAILTNIGNAYLEYYSENDTSTYHYLNEAKDKYFKALKISEELGDSSGIYFKYTSIANLYIVKKSYNLALAFHKKAYQIAKKIDDSYNQVSSLINISSVLYQEKKYIKAEQILKQAEQIAKQNNYKVLLQKIYGTLYSINKKLRKYDDAFYYSEAYDSLMTSIYDSTIAKNFSENEKKYNYELREKENIKLKAQNAIQEERNAKQRIYIMAMLFGILLLLALAFVILRGYQQKRKANELLTLQKKQIEEKNLKLTQLNEKIAHQRDLVESQKNQIENIHKELTHSIEYAKRIQSSILPNEVVLKSVFSEHFILFKPRDIVSGDFYWFSTLDDITIVTVADCTGHGVPGAILSMLGMSFLHEIVQKEFITHPGVILRRLRKEIINSLQQRGLEGEQKDGMDMALIAYNKKTNIVQYAGANNPLYVIKEEELEIKEENSAIKLLDNSKLKIQNSKFFYEIKPDKMPIAIYERMDMFQTQEIQLNKGDQLYLFSDGFADQFGGPKGKKLKYKPFKKLLLENSDKPMDNQLTILDDFIENWKGELEQIDDICVIGLKI